MNRIQALRLRLSALSVFRGVLSRSVPRAFYRLLGAVEEPPEVFLERYGEFFSLLSERGCADKLAFAFTEAALFDENIFTRSAAAGNDGELPEAVRQAAKRDIETILSACEISSETLLRCYPRFGEIAEIAPELPRWERGERAGGFVQYDGSLESAAKWYRENGCGIFARYKAFIWRDGDIQPVLNHDTVDVDDFIGYERQREKVTANTAAFLDGKSCNNCLLYGDMGTGKSSTVKAMANKFRKRGLRIVEMPKEQLKDFPKLVDKIARLPMKFIIFIDDLSFQDQDRSYTALKAVLEGGLAARPSNALIYATSNRRHIVKERLSDRSSMVDDVNTRDNMQETLSLSDRFGLTVCFTAPRRSEYLSIVLSLARRKGIQMTDAELCAGAERFALAKGGRSPRCAEQYVESLYC